MKGSQAKIMLNISISKTGSDEEGMGEWGEGVKRLQGDKKLSQLHGTQLKFKRGSENSVLSEQNIYSIVLICKNFLHVTNIL